MLKASVRQYVKPPLRFYDIIITFTIICHDIILWTKVAGQPPLTSLEPRH